MTYSNLNIIQFNWLFCIKLCFIAIVIVVMMMIKTLQLNISKTYFYNRRNCIVTILAAQDGRVSAQ